LQKNSIQEDSPLDETNKESNKFGSLNIFSNPVSEVLVLEIMCNLDVENTLYIANTLGKKVMVIDDFEVGKNTINVSALPKGIYNVVLRSEKSTHTQKFVKL
jgi:hypothetical protein